MILDTISINNHHVKVGERTGAFTENFCAALRSMNLAHPEHSLGIGRAMFGTLAFKTPATKSFIDQLEGNLVECDPEPIPEPTEKVALRDLDPAELEAERIMIKQHSVMTTVEFHNDTAHALMHMPPIQIQRRQEPLQLGTLGGYNYQTMQYIQPEPVEVGLTFVNDANIRPPIVDILQMWNRWSWSMQVGRHHFSDCISIEAASVPLQITVEGVQTTAMSYLVTFKFASYAQTGMANHFFSFTAAQARPYVGFVLNTVPEGTWDTTPIINCTGPRLQKD